MTAGKEWLSSVQSQSYRLLHHKRFWLCVGGMALFSLLLVLGLWSQVHSNFFGHPGEDSIAQFSIFTTVLRTSVQNPSALDVLYGGLASKDYCGTFLILFASVFASADFTSKTIHLSVAAGKSRAEVYITKMTAVMAGCLVIALVYLGVLFLSGGILFGFEGYLKLSGAVYLLRSVLSFLLFTIVSAGVIHFAAMLVRQELIVLGGLLVLSKVYYMVILKWLYTSGKIGRSLYEMTPEFQLLKTANRYVDYQSATTAALIALVYLLLFTVVGIRAFTRRDL